MKREDCFRAKRMGRAAMARGVLLVIAAVRILHYRLDGAGQRASVLRWLSF